MANPIDIATKPLQIGTKVAFGAIRGATQLVQGLTGGQGGEQQPQQEPEPARRKPAQRRSSRQPKPLDDVSITRKVETVIFRSDDVPKGSIDVNSADGVVWLRGEAKTPEMIKGLEAMAKEIPEVKRVENLLHLPHTPAPSRTDTPPAQRATRRAKPAPAKRKVTKEPVTSERHAASAEPAPKDLAQQHEGRQPAPLGSHATPGSTNGSGDDS